MHDFLKNRTYHRKSLFLIFLGADFLACEKHPALVPGNILGYIDDNFMV